MTTITKEEEREDTGEQLAETVVRNKAERYEELQNAFTDDRITEEEFESGLDELMESGEDFMDYDIHAEERKERRRERRAELLFRAKEIGQILLLVGVVGLGLAVMVFSQGKLLIPLLFLFVMMWLVSVLRLK